MPDEVMIDDDEKKSIPILFKPIILRSGPKFNVSYISFDKNSIRYTFK